MKTHHHYLLAVIIAMILSSATSFAQTVPDEAKKYYNRGQAALEMATSTLVSIVVVVGIFCGA